MGTFDVGTFDVGTFDVGTFDVGTFDALSPVAGSHRGDDAPGAEVPVRRQLWAALDAELRPVNAITF